MVLLLVQNSQWTEQLFQANSMFCPQENLLHWSTAPVIILYYHLRVLALARATAFEDLEPYSTVNEQFWYGGRMRQKEERMLIQVRKRKHFSWCELITGVMRQCTSVPVSSSAIKDRCYYIHFHIWCKTHVFAQFPRKVCTSRRNPPRACSACGLIFFQLAARNSLEGSLCSLARLASFFFDEKQLANLAKTVNCFFAKIWVHSPVAYSALSSGLARVVASPVTKKLRGGIYSRKPDGIKWSFWKNQGRSD